MKILISLSKESDSERLKRITYEMKRAKKSTTHRKNLLKAAERKLATAERYAKSDNPETAKKYKKRAMDAKAAVRNFQRDLNKHVKDIERREKMIAKLKAKK